MSQRRRKASLGDPKVAVAYLRVSKEEQNLGPDAQRASIALWATQQGIHVAAWELDKLTSVTPIDKRPGLLAALLALRTHNAGVLVVAKRDRLARDPMLTISIEQVALDAGAVVLSAAGEGNGSTPADEFMRGVIDTTSRYERALIRARTVAALGVKKARNERLGSAPFGKRSAPDGQHVTRLGERRCAPSCKGCLHLADDPHEQACIAEVLRLNADGVSQRKIARALWPRYKSRTGEPLAQLQVQNILRRAGMLTASIGDLAAARAKKSGATIATSRGDKTQATEAPEKIVALEVEKATEKQVEHPVTGQRLVNRRLVKRPDYLRHGRPVDLAWLRGQVKTLQAMGIPPVRIAAALVKTGVRRGDGSDVGAADVARWTAG